MRVDELIDSLADAGSHGDAAALLARLGVESGRVDEAELLLGPPLHCWSRTVFLHVSLRRADAAIARARKTAAAPRRRSGTVSRARCRD